MNEKLIECAICGEERESSGVLVECEKDEWLPICKVCKLDLDKEIEREETLERDWQRKIGVLP